MKKLAFLFIALVTILSISACRIEKTDVSNEPAKSYTLNLCDFQSIKNYTGCDIHFTQSDTYKVVLESHSKPGTPPIPSPPTMVRLVLVQKEERKKKGITVLHINAYDDDAEALDQCAFTGRCLYRRQWRFLCR